MVHVTDEMPSSSLFHLAMLSFSVIGQLVYHRMRESSKRPTESTLKRLTIPDLSPCDDPPEGLGLGREDPVVVHYVQDRTKCEEWAECPTAVS